MSALEIENIRKTYGAIETLKGIDISLDSGEFLVLLGSSGCGKSTLLNIIAGLAEASGGDVRIGGRSVLGVHPKDRDIAMVFQSYALYPHLTIFENIAFPLRARRRRTSDAEVARKVTEAADILGLSQLLERYPREVSGGQRQRVALGRAMVRTPTIYLLDEPLSNLDQQLRVQMRSELKDLHQRLGATMLYVTHDQGEALTLSDVIAVMSAGRIEQIGAPKDLYSRPANLFVARFLGEPGMNILEGQIEEGRLKAPGVALPIPDRLPAAHGGIVAGVRPEDLVAVEPARAALTGIVRTVEFLGSRSLLRVDVGHALVTAFLPPSLRAGPGEIIGLSPAHEGRVSWFDKASGIALDVEAG